MQIKSLDDVQVDIDALNELARRPDVDIPVRQRIELMIRFVNAGAKAERDAEYEIEFYARNRTDVATIHGLRIECNGRTAAIDHLIMNRRLQIWVCESKSVSEAVYITEHGEWWRSYQGGRQEMPSPIEQNKHHVDVLEDVFSSGLVNRRTSEGERLRPRISTLVVISKRGRIVRPLAGSQVDGLDTVIKCDLLMSKIKRANDESIAEPVVLLEDLVSSETLQGLATQLASLHAPSKRDWAARFGLPSEPLTLFADGSAGARDATSADPKPANVVALGGSRFVCAECRSNVSLGVANYCRDKASLFGSRILCESCQKRVTARGTLQVGAERLR